MRLELTRRTDQALRAMACLAEDDLLPGRRLAERIGVSTYHLSHVMGPLVAKGWVTSASGRNGGYQRVAALDAVSVLDLIEAVEGPTDTGECVLKGGPCPPMPHCALHAPWVRARTALLSELGRVPLGAVLDTGSESQGG